MSLRPSIHCHYANLEKEERENKVWSNLNGRKRERVSEREKEIIGEGEKGKGTIEH